MLPLKYCFALSDLYTALGRVKTICTVRSQQYRYGLCTMHARIWQAMAYGKCKRCSYDKRAACTLLKRIAGTIGAAIVGCVGVLTLTVAGIGACTRLAALRCRQCCSLWQNSKPHHQYSQYDSP